MYLSHIKIFFRMKSYQEGFFFHQQILRHHHVMPLMSAQNFSSSGSQAKQKAKQTITHLYLTFVPHHFGVEAKTSFQQLLFLASENWGKGALAADESKSTPSISLRELGVGIYFILKGSNKTLGFFCTAAML